MATDLVVRVHPVVLFQIVDSYERRNEDARRVIGTLLGTVEKGVIEVTNCFTVPHNESEDEVAVDMEFARNMHDLHKKVNAAEAIVGWYATGNDVTAYSVLIHEYYTRECHNPIHLTVDTPLKGSRMGMNVYVSSSMGVPGKSVGTMFTPIPLEMTYWEPERTGVNSIAKGKYNVKRTVNMVSDLQRVTEASSHIQEMMDTVISYVDDVINGRTAPDPSMGRYLAELVSKVPQIEQEEFEQMLNANMKDLLMVVYLSNLTATQLALSEKISLL
ncbi:PREDICTED: eukaryotic translation initiation factor 3 subunit F-like [Priapulus caudatus]|uniref:Eukaryotic translation initiation factor 3 subunit F n=1 Tax=Priapulus caudatus TaxID=37621 RepID=A0ABM1ELF5_PRICU|nr:PREDICTED: eukaryotic translation initiation factor 3 subunit F-like [Priapulus caudatus]